MDLTGMQNFMSVHPTASCRTAVVTWPWRPVMPTVATHGAKHELNYAGQIIKIPDDEMGR